MGYRKDVKTEDYMVKNNHEINEELREESMEQLDGGKGADGILNPELQGKKEDFCNPELKYPVQI